MSGEISLYKQVAKFAADYFHCHTVKQQIGTKLGRVDVIGLREVPGDLESASEVIAIEVKEETAAFLPALGQTHAYSIYAHHCYLAVKKRRNTKFTTEEIHIATRFGVGLIEIKSSHCKVILTSNHFLPQEQYFLKILAACNFFRCILCRGTYPHKDMVSINQSGPIDPQSDPKYRGRLIRAVAERKNVQFWLYELAKLRGDQRFYTYDRRYLCKDCVSVFASIAKIESCAE
jgi:hypothetical protein